MHRQRTTLAPLVVLALLAPACTDATGGPASEVGSSSTTDATGPRGSSAGVEDAPEATSGARGGTLDAISVPEILRFQTPLVGGGVLQGAELAGAPVALWFWAPW